MAKTARWIAIVASLCIGCAVQAATRTKPHARGVHEHSGHERGGHATYRTVRYARPSKPTTTQSHTSHTSRASKTKAHHATHHRYSRRRRYHHHVALPKAPSADRITQIQSALARGGYYTGDPTGRWDSNTAAAVQKFQSANNIDATGKLDAPTLQRLGLGSDIAGVAAPRPVVPKMCCTAGPTAPTGGATAAPAKPAGLTSTAPAATAVDHAQSVTVAPASAQSSAATANGASSVGVTPAAGSSAGSTSDPASGAKPAADQH